MFNKMHSGVEVSYIGRVGSEKSGTKSVTFLKWFWGKLL